jgi:hypothetical protein
MLIGRIEKQEIHIAIECPMLKSIVKHDAIDRTLREDPPAELITIRSDGHHSTRAALGDQKRLISRLLRSHENLTTIRHQDTRRSAVAAISTTQHGDPMAGGKKRGCHGNGDGRFAGSTDRQIPYADDTAGQSSLRQPASIVEHVATVGRPSIGN